MWFAFFILSVAALVVSHFWWRRKFAALEGRRDHIYQAVMLDPNAGATLTIAQIHAMVDELIEAHGDLMPDGIRTGRRVAGRA